jgi:hypothetical protein
MLNGWADQHSVVMWTRLTKNPEMNRSGLTFLIPSAEEVRKLDKQAPFALTEEQMWFKWNRLLAVFNLS